MASKVPCISRSPLREYVIMREISLQASQRDVRKYDFTCISRYSLSTFIADFNPSEKSCLRILQIIIIQRNYDVHEANLESRPLL